jgi:hypothetical protein
VKERRFGVARCLDDELVRAGVRLAQRHVGILQFTLQTTAFCNRKATGPFNEIVSITNCSLMFIQYPSVRLQSHYKLQFWLMKSYCTS